MRIAQGKPGHCLKRAGAKPPMPAGNQYGGMTSEHAERTQLNLQIEGGGWTSEGRMTN